MGNKRYNQGMDIKEIRRFRLRKLILTKFSGVSSRFAEHIGKQPSYIARIFSSKPEHARNIGESLAREIERLCGLEMGFLDKPLTSIELMGAFDPSTNPPSDDTTPPSENEEKLLAALKYSARDREVVVIERLQVEELGGPVESIELEVSWLKRNVTFTDVDNLWLLTNVGDSMAPTIRDGDLILVDNGVNSVAYDAIYVFGINGQIRINRIQRELDGGLRVISDNPRYHDQLITSDRRGEIGIAARVVYAWSGSAF